MAPLRRRISPTLATILVLAMAGGLSWWGARSTAAFIEDRSLQDVQVALRSAGYDWAGVETDGLQVRLTGTAPSEVDRFRAMTQAATAVDSSRILDQMTVAAAEALDPPDFKVELLRNPQGISLIGLVPASTDRNALLRSLRSETSAPKVTDLLETADYKLPEGWQAALDYGIQAAQMAGSAKISIQPGAVTVAAITDSRAEKGRLETALKRAVPKGVRLTSQITAPRPVIAPFTMRFVIDGDGPRFEACSAATEDGRQRILEAALSAGLQGKPGCTLGLGAPSPDWDEAAEQAIAAVARLGQGTVTISDADVALTAPEAVTQVRFDEAAGRLEQALPRVFSLHAELERESGQDAGPAEFIAALSGDRALSMRGRIADVPMREAVDSFARARFSEVDSSLRSDAAVPDGWTVRVIGALEAMAVLESGTVQVTPDMLRMAGTSGDPNAAENAAAALSNRIGAGARYALSIRYDRRLDPALDLPDGQECVRRLNLIMSESEIGFEPGKSTIAGDPQPTLARLAEAMTECADFQIEAGGHTDAQGSQGFNADLSRARAQALVAAMAEAGIDTANLTARGYGESQPIASNDTEAGREENRRIEFRLLSEMPIRNTPLPVPILREGVTSEPVAPLQGPPAPDIATSSGMAPEGGAATSIDAVQGPQRPQAGESRAVPATVGVSEQVPALDDRDETVRLPVQTPGADTPRPSPRPEDAATSATGQEQQDTTPAP
ncbi:MAG: flagellar motor protein MotB [Paracoccus sp.]|nr:flagellar motor protein MotB [Paracoccus sp. (in: a-proteobacteria)]